MKRNFKKLEIALILFLGLISISPNFVPQKAEASQLQSEVIITVCGNGVIEGGESCDDGANNGRYAYNAQDRFCNSTCSGWASYCGDNTVQSSYNEECDDGNNNAGDGCSATCQDEGDGGNGGRGGGGGGWTPPPVPTKVVIQGKAYPEAKITLLEDGKLTTIIQADELADFEIEITDITPGVWTFSLWAEDKMGRRSITFSFTANVISGMITTISGIFIPPTIELSKVNLQKGETLDIYGQTAPESEVSTHIESTELIKKTKAGLDGDWLQNVETGMLEEGMHTSRAKAVSPGGLSSSFSKLLAFYIGDLPPGVICLNADLNGDGKVNLIDFSILLHWWGTSNTCADQNHNGIVDFPDFSIMLHYWTG